MAEILHISDLHFVKNADAYNMEQILLREAAAVKALPRGEKLLIVTGDLHNFRDADYRRAAQLLKKLAGIMDLDLEQDLFLVPGNHDVGNDAALDACFGDNPAWKKLSRAAVSMLKNRDTDYLEDRLRAFRPYCRFVRELMRCGACPEEDGPARVHVRNWRGKLNILHLNTALIADGAAKDDQMADIDAAADPETWKDAGSEDTPALAIGHNSFFDLERTQRQALEAVFARRNVSAYLCGDTHRKNLDPDEQAISLESGLKGNRESIPNVVCAKSVADLTDNYSDFGYYWHHWNEATGWVTLEFRRWNREYLGRTVPEGEGEGYPMRTTAPAAAPVRREPGELLSAPDYPESAVTAFFDDLAERFPDVRSYAFIYQIHQMFLPHEKDGALLRRMQELLEKDLRKNSGGDPVGFLNSSTARRDFAVYYCLGLYCKRQKKVDGRGGLSLKKLLDRYGGLFSGFPLHWEVEGWYCRRKVDRVTKPESKLLFFRQAGDCDREMMKEIPLEENAGVYSSFASTVSKKLEYEYERGCRSLWPTQEERLKDWEEAVAYIPRIIDAYKEVWKEESDYGKHHFIRGKLYLFAPNSRTIDPERRREQIERAKEDFFAALDCENSDDPDYGIRRQEYNEYTQKCEEQNRQIGADSASTGTYTIRCDYGERTNRRPRLKKPNEDFQLRSEESGVFILADGVTRPHAEYQKSALCNLAAECARELCQTIQNKLLLSAARERDPVKRMREALIAGNRSVREFGEKKWRSRVQDVSASYPPCCTLLLALLSDDVLYFYNCCDTVGYLIRNEVKMCFTDHYNWRAEREGYPKATVYRELHNNPAHKAGFAIVNGDERFESFLRIGQLKVASGDRLILSTDGLAEFLLATGGAELREMTAEDMLRQSAAYDQAPFRKYADDKSCIIIDVL